jgi:hypothetical protein
MSQSQSHIATDGQSISKSWCRAPSGAHDQIFITVDSYSSTVTVLFLWGTLSDERRGLSFGYAAGPRQQSFSGPSPVGLVTILYCLIFETSLFVVSYDSQGHGGAVLPRLHTGGCGLSYIASARTAQKTFLPLLRVLSLPEKRFQSRSLATAAYGRMFT